MKIKYFILTLGFCLGILFQTKAQIISSVQVPNDTLDLGQPFDLGFSFYSTEPNLVEEIDLSSIFKLENLLQQDTSLPPEIVDLEVSSYGNWPVNQEKAYPKPESWNKTNKGYSLNYFIKAIIWDPGVYQIGGLEAKVDSNYQLDFAESRYLLVQPPKRYQAQDTTSLIADIKPILDEPVKFEDFHIYLYLLLGGLLLFGLYKLLNKKKAEIETEVETEPEIIIPAHVIAFDKLDKLKAKELWQQGKIKAYQSELTFVIREYLENRYDIKALESTTDEILKDLKKVDFDQANKNDLKDILTMADLVKFAKAKPGESIHESFMVKAIELVANTKNESLEVDG